MADTKKNSTDNAKRYYQGPSALPKWSEEKRLKFRQGFSSLLQDDAYVLSPEGGMELRKTLQVAQQQGLVPPDFVKRFEQYRSERYRAMASSPLINPQTGEKLYKTAAGPRQLNPQTGKYEAGPVRTVPMLGADLAVGGGMYIGADPNKVQSARSEILKKQAESTASDVERYKAVQDVLEGQGLTSTGRNIGAGLLGVPKGIYDASRTALAGIPGVGEFVSPPSVEELQRKYTTRPLDEMTPEMVMQDQQQAGRLAGYEFGRQGAALAGGVLGSSGGAAIAGLAGMAAAPVGAVVTPLLVAAGSLGGGIAGQYVEDSLMARAYGGQKNYERVRGVFAQANQEAPGARFAADLAATLVQGSPVLASGIGTRRMAGLLGATARGEAVELRGTLQQLGIGARKIEESVDAANQLRVLGKGGPGEKFDTLVSNFLQKTKAAPQITPDELMTKQFVPDATSFAGRVKQLGQFVQNTPAANQYVADAIGEQGVNLAFATSKYLKNYSDYVNDTTGMVEKPSTLEALGELAFGSLFIGNNKFTDAVSSFGDFASGAVTSGLERIPGVGGLVEAGRKRLAESEGSIADNFLRQSVLREIRKQGGTGVAALGTRERLSRLPNETQASLGPNERIVSLATGKVGIFDVAAGTVREVDYAEVGPSFDDTASVEENLQATNAVKNIPTKKTGNIIERRFGLGGQEGDQVVPQEGPAKQQIAGIKTKDGQAHVVIREVPEIIENGKPKRGLLPEYTVVRLEDIDQPRNRAVAKQMILDAGVQANRTAVQNPSFTEQIFIEQDFIRQIEKQIEGTGDKQKGKGAISRHFPTTVVLDNQAEVSGRIVDVANNGDVILQLMSMEDSFIRVDPVNIRRGLSKPLTPIRVADIAGEIEMSSSLVEPWRQKFDAVQNPEQALHTVADNTPVLLTGEQQAWARQLNQARAIGVQKGATPQQLAQLSNRVFDKDTKLAENDYAVGSLITVFNPSGNEELGVVMSNTDLGPIVYLDSLGGRPIIVQEPNIQKGTATKKAAKPEAQAEAKPPTARQLVAEVTGEKPPVKKEQKGEKSKKPKDRMTPEQAAAILGTSTDTRIKVDGKDIDFVVVEDGKNVNLVHRTIEKIAHGESLNEVEQAIVKGLKLPRKDNVKWYVKTQQEIAYLNDSLVREVVDGIISDAVKDPSILTGAKPIVLDYRTMPDGSRVKFTKPERERLVRAMFADNATPDGLINREAISGIARQPVGVVVSALAQSNGSDVSTEDVEDGDSGLNELEQVIRLGSTELTLDLTRRVFDRQSFEQELKRLLSQAQGVRRPAGTRAANFKEFLNAVTSGDFSYILAQQQVPEDPLRPDVVVESVPADNPDLVGQTTVESVPSDEAILQQLEERFKNKYHLKPDQWTNEDIQYAQQIANWILTLQPEATLDQEERDKTKATIFFNLDVLGKLSLIEREYLTEELERGFLQTANLEQTHDWAIKFLSDPDNSGMASFMQEVQDFIRSEAINNFRQLNSVVLSEDLRNGKINILIGGGEDATLPASFTTIKVEVGRTNDKVNANKARILFSNPKKPNQVYVLKDWFAITGPADNSISTEDLIKLLRKEQAGEEDDMTPFVMALEDIIFNSVSEEIVNLSDKNQNKTPGQVFDLGGALFIPSAKEVNDLARAALAENGETPQGLAPLQALYAMSARRNEGVDATQPEEVVQAEETTQPEEEQTTDDDTEFSRNNKAYLEAAKRLLDGESWPKVVSSTTVTRDGKPASLSAIEPDEQIFILKGIANGIFDSPEQLSVYLQGSNDVRVIANAVAAEKNPDPSAKAIARKTAKRFFPNSELIKDSIPDEVLAVKDNSEGQLSYPIDLSADRPSASLVTDSQILSGKAYLIPRERPRMEMTEEDFLPENTVFRNVMAKDFQEATTAQEVKRLLRLELQRITNYARAYRADPQKVGKDPTVIKDMMREFYINNDNMKLFQFGVTRLKQIESGEQPQATAPKKKTKAKPSVGVPKTETSTPQAQAGEAQTVPVTKLKGGILVGEDGQPLRDVEGNALQGNVVTANWLPFPSMQQLQDANLDADQIKLLEENWNNPLRRWQAMQIIAKIWDGGIWDGRAWKMVTLQSIFEPAIDAKNSTRDNRVRAFEQVKTGAYKRNENVELQNLNNQIRDLQIITASVKDAYRKIAEERAKVGLPIVPTAADEFFPTRTVGEFIPTQQQVDRRTRLSQKGGERVIPGEPSQFPSSTPGRKIPIPRELLDPFVVPRREFPDLVGALERLELDVDVNALIASNGNVKDAVNAAIKRKINELESQETQRREVLTRVNNNRVLASEGKQVKKVKTQYVVLTSRVASRRKGKPEVQEVPVEPFFENNAEEEARTADKAKAVADMFDTFIHAAQSRRIDLLVDAVQKGYFAEPKVRGAERRLQPTNVRGDVKPIMMTDSIESDLRPLEESFRQKWEESTGDKLSPIEMRDLFVEANSDSDASLPLRNMVNQILEVVSEEQTSLFYQERMPVFANFGNTIPFIQGLNGAYLNIYDSNRKTSTKVLMAFGSANFTTFVEELSHAFLEGLPMAIKGEIAATMGRPLRVPTLMNPSIVSKELQEEFATALMVELAGKSFQGTSGDKSRGNQARAALRDVLNPVGEVIEQTYLELINKARDAKSRSMVRSIGTEGKPRFAATWEVPYTSVRGGDPSPSVMLWRGAPVFLHDGRKATVQKQYSTKDTTAETWISVAVTTPSGDELIMVPAGDIRAIGEETFGLNPTVMSLLSSWVGEKRKGLGIGVSTPTSRRKRFLYTDGGQFAGVYRHNTATTMDYRTNAGVTSLLSMFGFQKQSPITWSTLSRFLPEDVVDRVWNLETMRQLGLEYAKDPEGSVKQNPDIAAIVQAYASSNVYEGAVRLSRSDNALDRKKGQFVLSSINKKGNTNFKRGVKAYLSAMSYNRQSQLAVQDALKQISNGAQEVILKSIPIITGGKKRISDIKVVLAKNSETGYPALSSNGAIRVYAGVAKPASNRIADVRFVYEVNLQTGEVAFKFMASQNRKTKETTYTQDVPDSALPIPIGMPLQGGTVVLDGKPIKLSPTRVFEAEAEVVSGLKSAGIHSNEWSPRVVHPLYWVARGINDNYSDVTTDAAWNLSPSMNPAPRVQATFLGQSNSDPASDAAGNPTLSDLLNQVLNPQPTSASMPVVGGTTTPVSTSNPNRILVTMSGTSGTTITDIYESAAQDMEAGRDEDGKRKYQYVANVIDSEISTAFDQLDADFNVSIEPAVVMLSTPEVIINGTINIPKGNLSDVVARAARVGQRTNQPNMFVLATAPNNKTVGTVVTENGAFIVPTLTVSLSQPLSRSELVSYIGAGFGMTEARLSNDGKSVTFVQIPKNKEYNREQAIEWIQSTKQRLKDIFGIDGEKATSGKSRLWNLGSSELGGVGAFTEYGRVLDLVSYDQSSDPFFRQDSIGKATGRRLRRELNRIVSIVSRTKINLPANARFNRERMPDTARRDIATAYDQIPEEIDDPYVSKAYEALTKELDRQFKALKLNVEFMPETVDADGNVTYEDPYGGNNSVAVSDILNKQRIFIRRSNVQDTGLIKDSILSRQTTHKSVDGTALTYMDLLRAIHDSISYSSNATTFGRDSDEMSYIAHMLLTKDNWAKWALAMETRVPDLWMGNNGRAFNPDGTQRTDAPETMVFPRKDGLIAFDSLYTGVVTIDDSLRRFGVTLKEQHGNYRGTVAHMFRNDTLPGGKEVPVAPKNGPLNQPDVEPLVEEDESLTDEAIIHPGEGIVRVPPGTIPPVDFNPDGEDGGEAPQRSRRRVYPRNNHAVSSAQRAVFVLNTILRQGASGDASPILMQNWSLANLITNPQLLGRQLRLIPQVAFNPNLGFQRKDGSFINQRGMAGRRMANKVMNEEVRALPGYSIMEEAGMFLGAYKIDNAFEELKEKRAKEGKPAPTLEDVSELGYDLDVRDDSGLLKHWPGQAQSERFFTLSRDIVKMNTASNFIQHLVDLGYNPTNLYVKDEEGYYILGEDGLPQLENTPFANAMRDLANLLNIMTGDVRVKIDDIQDEKVMRMGKILMFSPRWLTSRFLLNDMGRGMLRFAFNLRGPEGAKFVQELFQSNGVSEEQLKRRDRRVETLNARLLWKSWLMWMALLAALWGNNQLNPHTLGVKVDNWGTRLRVGDYTFRMPGAMMLHLEILSSIANSVGKWQELKGVEGEPTKTEIVFDGVNSLLMSRASPILRFGVEMAYGRDAFGQPSFIADDAAEVFLRQGMAPELERLGLASVVKSDVGKSMGKTMADILGVPLSKYVMWWPVRDAMEAFYKQRQLDVDRRNALMNSLLLGAGAGIGGRINYQPDELKWEYKTNERMARDTSALDWKTYILGGRMVAPPVDSYEPTDDMLDEPIYDGRIGAPDFNEEPSVSEGLSIPDRSLEEEVSVF